MYFHFHRQTQVDVRTTFRGVQIDAFEMWVWRKMQKVRWSERRTNEEVLEMVDEKRSLMDRIIRSKKKWIGHIVRGDGLLKEVIEGRMDGKRPRKELDS